jgi:hypothetical protein
MQERCPNCGLKFEREQGYFLGAMYISYGLALITIIALGLLLWASTPGQCRKSPSGPFCCSCHWRPHLRSFSRVLWIYLDQAIDPE